jgi:hypothetical protein
MEIIFTASNLLVLPFWFLMIVVPRWRWTLPILQSPLVLMPFLLLYAVLALPLLGVSFGLSFSTLS